MRPLTRSQYGTLATTSLTSLSSTGHPEGLVAIWDATTSILYFPLEYIDRSLTSLSDFAERISVSNQLEYDTLLLVYKDLAIFITTLFFAIAIL